MVEFLQAAEPDGPASFVGIERVTGRLAGRAGTFSLQTPARWRTALSAGNGSWSGLGNRPAFRAARRGRVPRRPRRERPGPPGLLVRMTTTTPAQGAGRTVAAEAAGGSATLVLSRAVLPGHRQAFEDILLRLAAEARAFPGYQGLTVLRPSRRPAYLHDRRALRHRARPGRLAVQRCPGPAGGRGRRAFCGQAGHPAPVWAGGLAGLPGVPVIVRRLGGRSW